jgi:hypothetical protein
VANEIVVAFIGGGFGLVIALVNKYARENRKDHGTVHTALGRIEQKIDGHIETHNE